MWLVLTLIVGSLASVTLSSQSLDLAGTCPWSPQIRPWDPSAATPAQAACSKNESKSDSWTTSWSGPRACVGSYCVYANAAIGGGIVLLTTDRNAKRVKELQLLTPGASDSSSLQDRPFVERALSGKGLGLVAKRHIHRGELVMVEAPAMLVQKRVLGDRSGRYIESLDLAARSLPAARRKAFMRQGRAGDGAGGYEILDILLTNSFRLSLAGEGEAAGFHYGNYPNASRINHDCRPKYAGPLLPFFSGLLTDFVH